MGSTHIPITYQGVTYPTLTAACEVAGVKTDTVYARSARLQISKQEAFDQVVEEGVRKHQIPIMYQGVTYPSVRSACEVADINPSAVRARGIKLEIPTQEAFDQIVEEGIKRTKIPIMYQGVTYPSISSACEAARISRGTVGDRSCRLGISPQEAFDQIVTEGLKQSKILITYQGVTYPTLASACKAAGISNVTVYGRSRRLGISPQESFDQVVEGVKKAKILITYQGISYASIPKACRAAGIKSSTVRNKIYNLGISAQEAFDQSLVREDDPKFMTHSIGISSSNNLINVKYAYVSRSGVNYFTCTCKVCNRRILIPYDTAKSYRHVEEFCIDHEYKGR